MKQPGGDSLTSEVKARLDVLVDLIGLWTARINLVSSNDRQHIWGRHISDSLQLANLFPPQAGRAIDLGSGGGFPGLVLAIATGVHFDLIESDRRKAAFLREAIRATEASADVHACRIQDYRSEMAPLVTARALAPLPLLLQLVELHLRNDGHALLLKGANVAAELTQAKKKWHMVVRQVPSTTDPRAHILDITELHRVGPRA